MQKVVEVQEDIFEIQEEMQDIVNKKLTVVENEIQNYLRCKIRFPLRNLGPLVSPLK